MAKPPITLGDLIVLLKHRDQEQSVGFDFGGMKPKGIHSYRGYYEQLAIGYVEDGEYPKVADLLKDLQEANGKTFTGYKGGEFEMHSGTPMWAANYGRCHSTAITGIADCSWMTILETGFVD